MWIPVRVVENDDVGGGEVDAQAAGARGQHEDEDVGAGRVVGVDALLSLLVGRGPVQATMLEAFPHAVVLQDVQHARHLTEDQHAIACGIGKIEMVVEDSRH